MYDELTNVKLYNYYKNDKLSDVLCCQNTNNRNIKNKSHQQFKKNKKINVVTK